MLKSFEILYVPDNTPKKDEKKDIRWVGDAVYVAVRAKAHLVEVWQRAEDSNIFEETAVALAKIKTEEGMERGAMLQYVADKMCLQRVLVKAILKKYENGIDVQTKTHHQSLENPQQFYLFTTEDGTQFLPVAMAWDAFQQRRNWKAMGSHGETVSIVSKQVAQGAPIYASVVATNTNPRRAFDLDGQQILDKFQKTSYYKKLRKGEESRWVSASNRRVSVDVAFVVRCQYIRDNMVKYTMVTPFLDCEVVGLREQIEGFWAGNATVERGIQAMKQEVLRRQSGYLKKTTVFPLALQSYVLSQFPNVEQDPTLQLGLFHLEAAWQRYCRPTNMDSEQQSVEKGAVFLAASDLIKTVLLRSFQTYFDVNSCTTYQDTIARLSRSRGIAHCADMARQVGFSTTAEDKIPLLQAFKLASLAYLVEHRDGDTVKNVATLTMGNLLLACVHGDNPFWKVAVEYPCLLDMLHQLQSLRNQAKHEGAVGSAHGQFSPEMLYELSMDLVDLLLIPRQKGAAQLSNQEQWQKKMAIESASQERLKGYPSLDAHEELQPWAYQVVVACLGQDGEFASTCYNLFDRLFDEILEEYTTDAQRNKAVSRFAGKLEADREQFVQLVTSQGGQYQGRSFSNTAKLLGGNSIRWKKQPPWVKAYVAFAIEDAPKLAVLRRKIVEEVPEMLDMLDSVCQLRKNPTTADGYEAMMDAVLDSCQRVCQLMEEMTTKENTEE